MSCLKCQCQLVLFEIWKSFKTTREHQPVCHSINVTIRRHCCYGTFICLFFNGTSALFGLLCQARSTTKEAIKKCVLSSSSLFSLMFFGMRLGSAILLSCITWLMRGQTWDGISFDEWQFIRNDGFNNQPSNGAIKSRCSFSASHCDCGSRPAHTTYYNALCWTWHRYGSSSLLFQQMSMHEHAQSTRRIDEEPFFDIVIGSTCSVVNDVTVVKCNDRTLKIVFHHPCSDVLRWVAQLAVPFSP